MMFGLMIGKRAKLIEQLQAELHERNQLIGHAGELFLQLEEKIRSLEAEIARLVAAQESPTEKVKKIVAELIGENPDKLQLTIEKPDLSGWFVGQAMKKAHSIAGAQ